ncbi:hypothetical protein AAG570_005428 [Ranatra chinensis]|uniref:Uncharacterized protein n=1 Tax=Ranatra chinensis TaxID=642074 RepID=A0ABD0YCF7_9HEMI
METCTLHGRRGAGDIWRPPEMIILWPYSTDKEPFMNGSSSRDSALVLVGTTMATSLASSARGLLPFSCGIRIRANASQLRPESGIRCRCSCGLVRNPSWRSLRPEAISSYTTTGLQSTTRGS